VQYSRSQKIEFCPTIHLILLARLAVDRSQKGKGLGKALVRDALIRAIQATDIASLRAFLIHAKDENAKNCVRRFIIR